MNYSYLEIASELQCVHVGKTQGFVRHIITDSRYPIYTEDSLFVALYGNRFDGHLFINDLYSQGCRAFLVEHLPENTMDDAAFFVVSSTLKALQRLASWHRSHFQFPVIGITGSYGKSIVKEWLYDMLSNHYNVVRSPKSFNSQLGVPLSVLQISESNNLGLFEAGISKPSEMQVLLEIIKPTIGIITNIGNAHQENFSSTQEKIEEKIKLFEHANYIIYPSKYNQLGYLLQKKYASKNILSWGEQKNDFLKIKSIESDSAQTIVNFEIDNNLLITYLHSDPSI